MDSSDCDGPLSPKETLTSRWYAYFKMNITFVNIDLNSQRMCLYVCELNIRFCYIFLICFVQVSGVNGEHTTFFYTNMA